MTTPCRYWALNSSTNSRTPALAMTTSSAAGSGSTLRLYLKPEQPPGRTATRNPTVSGVACSSARNLRTSSPARSVSVSVTVGFCVVLITILRSGRNLEGPRGAVNGARRRPACFGARRTPNWWPYDPHLHRLADHRAVLRVQHRDRLLLQGARREEHQRILPVGTECPLVARRHVDGRDHVCRRYPPRRDGVRGEERHRRQLAVVVLRRQR